MIIGIAGKIGSGKDLVARMINFIYKYSDKYQDFYYKKGVLYENICHFADKLKEICSILINEDYEKFSDREFKNSSIPLLLGSPSIRKLLQDVGTCMKEKIDPDLWIKLLFEKTKNWKLIIIPDVRFQNEVDAIHERGGIVIQIIRDDKFNTPQDIKQHISETELDTITNFDYTIINNKSVEDLFGEILRIYNKVCK